MTRAGVDPLGATDSGGRAPTPQLQVGNTVSAAAAAAEPQASPAAAIIPVPCKPFKKRIKFVKPVSASWEHEASAVASGDLAGTALVDGSGSGGSGSAGGGSTGGGQAQGRARTSSGSTEALASVKRDNSGGSGSGPLKPGRPRAAANEAAGAAEQATAAAPQRQPNPAKRKRVEFADGAVTMDRAAHAAGATLQAPTAAALAAAANGGSGAAATVAAAAAAAQAAALAPYLTPAAAANPVQAALPADQLLMPGAVSLPPFPLAVQPLGAQGVPHGPRVPVAGQQQAAAKENIGAVQHKLVALYRDYVTARNAYLHQALSLLERLNTSAAVPPQGPSAGKAAAAPAAEKTQERKAKEMAAVQRALEKAVEIIQSNSAGVPALSADVLSNPVLSAY